MSITAANRRFLIIRFALAIILGGGVGFVPAQAATQFSILNQSAISVANPATKLLVSIVNAGSRLVAGGEHGVIIYSDDNAKSWRQAAVPVGATITAIAFSTPQIGWAAAGYGIVLHTVDGGADWTMQLNGLQLNQMMLTNASQTLAADPSNIDAQRAVRRANRFVLSGPDKPFLSVLALTPQNAMIFGAYRMCVKTIDAGKDWSDCSLGIADPISHNLYDAITDGSTIDLVTEIGGVFQSDDGGASFARINEPTGTTLFGILTATKDVLLAYGVAGQMIRSTDSGKTWAPVMIGTDSNITAAIALKSGTILIVSEAGGVFQSTDHGALFHQVMQNLGMNLYALAQAKNGDIVFAGSAGIHVMSLE